MIVTLPWPPRETHPNARVHYHAKAKATEAYRTKAYWLCHAAKQAEIDHTDAIPVKVTFYPPDKRRRDLDGLLSSIKAGIDGIADAVGVNDYRINPITIERAEPVKGGRVEVVL